MINKLLIISMFLSSMVTYSSDYSPVYTKSAVILAGSVIASQHMVDNKKYKRKDCPICKGKGWYISGDEIKKVDCGYCEEDTKNQPVEKPSPKVLIHNPITITPNCISGTCSSTQRK
jgi:hypothetical protein